MNQQQNHHHHHQNCKTFIVNLDSDNLPGSHWVAAAKNQDTGTMEIFDSFGLPPPPLLQSWASKWMYEPTVMIQDPDADTCGYYALIFCIARPYFNSLLDTLQYISTLRI